MAEPERKPASALFDTGLPRTVPIVIFAVAAAVVLGLISVNTDLSRGGALLSWLAMTALAAWLIARSGTATDAASAPRAMAASGPIEGSPAERLGPLLDRLPIPFLLFGKGRRIRFMNRAAQDLLGMDAVGRDFAAAIRNPDVLSLVDRVIAGEPGDAVEFQLRQPRDRHLRIRVESLAPGMDAQAGFIALLDDLTDTIRLNQVRAEFVADVSHELRTPLASVISIVETLNGPARDDPAAQARFLTMLDEQANRMSGIVQDLLSLSRIEMNVHSLPDEAVNLTEVLEGLLPTSRLRAAERDMHINLTASGPILVTGDALELTRLFQNLIDNAVNYGAEGTDVTISAVLSEHAVAVSVRDHGAGIAREHIPRLTERFYRVDKGRSRAVGGTGLGLAIVKHVTNRHRGRLQVESEVGQGSRFTVELPLRDEKSPQFQGPV